MRVAVCVPWRSNGCPRRDASWEWVRQRWEALFPRYPIVIGGCEGEWNTAAALNDAVSRTTADIMIMTGADCVVGQMDVIAAVNQAASGRWVMLAGEMVRPSRDTSDRILACEPTRQLGRIAGPRRKTRLGWGPLVVPRSVMRTVGGWDERLVSWYEDDVFGMAAQCLSGEPYRIPGQTVLLWHPPPIRTHHPAHRANVALRSRYKAAAADPIVMRALLDEGAREHPQRCQGGVT